MAADQIKQTSSIGLRSAEEVLTLAKMGSAFQTRLSFMRSLIRKIHTQKWQLERREFNIDNNGFGYGVYTVRTQARTYSLVVFSHDLPAEKRTDRVIAEAWDATFTLFDGVPTEADIERLAANVPLQEAGRVSKNELALGRANKSLRMFALILDCLKKGVQPDIDKVAGVGYLMRTTAVYGSGKFGCADRSAIEARPEIQSSFQAEMLAVYLFRWFTLDLIDHIAKAQAPETAVTLDTRIKRFLGIGNSTGLGMAPFLLKHTKLLHQWVSLKEEALCRVRNHQQASNSGAVKLKSVLSVARTHIAQWNVEDKTQTAVIKQLRDDMTIFSEWLENTDSAAPAFWENTYQFAQSQLSVEAVSFIESLMIECNGALVDTLADQMFEEQGKIFEPDMTTGSLLELIQTHYDWVDEIDFNAPENTTMFWYYSEEKLEPRFGNRQEIPGAELEMPLAIARDIALLKKSLIKFEPSQQIADYLLTHHEDRHLVRRIQTVAYYPYGEVRDNLVSTQTRPIDLLRFKLAFFGASKFDPKSNLWTRINMFQGAPLAEEILDIDPDLWAYPIKPEITS